GAQRRRQDRLRRQRHQAASAALLAGDQAVGALRALAASRGRERCVARPSGPRALVVRLARRACAPVPAPGPRALACATSRTASAVFCGRIAISAANLSVRRGRSRTGERWRSAEGGRNGFRLYLLCRWGEGGDVLGAGRAVGGLAVDEVLLDRRIGT